MNVLNIRCITFKAIGYIILSQRHAQADSRRPDSMSVDLPTTLYRKRDAERDPTLK